MTGRIILSHAGGPRTLAAISMLAEKHRADVVTLTLDFGHEKDLEEVRDRALAAGAVRAHVLDVADEFVRCYVLRALKADALDVNGRSSPEALVQAIAARKLVDIAHIEQAMSVAHGYGPSRGAGARARLEAALRALDSTLTILPVPRDDSSSVALGTEAVPLRPAMLEAPAEPAFVEISFTRGEPTAINGIAMPLVELIDSLSMIAGVHGIGGPSAPGSTPALSVLAAAHRELQRQATVSDGLSAVLREVSQHYADVIVKGLWFVPLREALDAFIEKIQEQVNGVVRLKMFKGDCVSVETRRQSTVLSRQSPVLAIGGLARDR